MNILPKVNTIIAKLQDGKWSELSPKTLVSAQGKLSTYTSNVGAMVATARKLMDATELNAKHYEAQQFLEYRTNGESIQSSQANARVEAFNHWTRHYDAKASYADIKFVLEAMTSMITACQVTIRELKNERQSYNYEGK